MMEDSAACSEYHAKISSKVNRFLIIQVYDYGRCLKADWFPRLILRKDSLRFFYPGAEWGHRVEHVGAKATVDKETL